VILMLLTLISRWRIWPSISKDRWPRTATRFFFFLVIHYLHATYGDNGENIYSPFPVRCPRSGDWLQAPLLPSAQACPTKE